MSWNMPVHHRPDFDARRTVNGENSTQDARTARTVAEHATDAEDCRVLLEMLGLRLDVLRANKPPAADEYSEQSDEEFGAGRYRGLAT